MNSEPKIATVFVGAEGGALGEPPETLKIFEERKSSIMKKLGELFPHTEFVPHDIRNLDDASKVVDETKDAVGYLIFVFNCIHGLMRPLLWSDKPTVMMAETYGASGDFLLEYSRARAGGKPVVGIVTRSIEDGELLRKHIELLHVIHRLHTAKTLFITSPGVKQLLRGEYPLSIDLYGYLRSIQALFGVTPVLLDSKEFVDEYYSKVPYDEAKEIAEKWIKEASRVVEDQTDEIIESAKFYVSLRKAIKDRECDAVAVDCIVIRKAGLLDAWPCLAFMELVRRGEGVPVCEADPFSAVALLIMKYLANRPGFITDPSPDNLTDEVVYYHCYAPTTPYSYGDKNTVPYVITPAHLGSKKASVYVDLPTDETITVVGLNPEEKILTLHTAKAVRNEYSLHACSVKLVGKTNTKAIVKNWRWRSGWHRVVFYGDWRKQLEDLATLLGLRVIEEDNE